MISSFCLTGVVFRRLLQVMPGLPKASKGKLLWIAEGGCFTGWTGCPPRTWLVGWLVGNNNNNNHDDIYSAVIMTGVIARVHSVYLVNLRRTAPSGRRPSDQAT